MFMRYAKELESKIWGCEGPGDEGHRRLKLVVHRLHRLRCLALPQLYAVDVVVLTLNC